MESAGKSPDAIDNYSKQVGRDAADMAKRLAGDAMKVADNAATCGTAYFQDPVEAAGKKFDGVKLPGSQTSDYRVKAINDESVKTVLIAAVVGSLITAFLLTALRDRA